MSGAHDQFLHEDASALLSPSAEELFAYLDSQTIDRRLQTPADALTAAATSGHDHVAAETDSLYQFVTSPARISDGTSATARRAVLRRPTEGPLPCPQEPLDTTLRPRDGPCATRRPLATPSRHRR